MGKIVILMGQSSSGKDTIMRKLLENNQYNLHEIIMHTTRPMREGEVMGREYYFCSEEEMHNIERENKIIELRKYETVYGPWYYFTTSSNIDLENNDYIILNTLEGFDQFKKYYGDNVISILINTDDGLRLERALNREKKEKVPKYKEMCRRFLADCEDFSKENIEKRKIDAVVDNNGTIEQTVEEINRVLKLYL